MWVKIERRKKKKFTLTWSFILSLVSEWGGLGFSRNNSTKGSNQKSSLDNNSSDILKALLDGACDNGVQHFDEFGVWDPERKVS